MDRMHQAVRGFAGALGGRVLAGRALAGRAFAHRGGFALFALLSTSSLLTAGCSQVLAIEVLPPRTSATCSAPGLNSNASGRGLLDVNATETLHGAYVGDLRIAATGNLLVDGVALTFTAPEGASGATTTAAEEASGEQPLGDVLLVGVDDDVREAVVEEVVLLPRSLAVALRDDDDLELDETEFATVVVELTARAAEQDLMGATGTYRIDVCKGCLVTRPAEDDCDNGIEELSVCRPGQDKKLFGCAPPPSGGLFP